MTSSPHRPKITIAIPLFRARPYVENIVQDIKSLNLSGVEIVFSDQHCYDNALEEIEQHLGSDLRVRIFKSADELRWWENYNFLLRKARGEFVIICQQDNRLPPGSIDAAVLALKSAPDAIGAYGPVDLIDTMGNVIRHGARHKESNFITPTKWRNIDAFAAFSGMRHPNATLGVFRRDLIVGENMFIQETAGQTGLSIRIWLFEMLLPRRVLFVPNFIIQQRIHAESYTSVNWQRSNRAQIARLISYFKVGSRVWWKSPNKLSTRIVGIPFLFFAAFLALPILRISQRYFANTRRVIEIRTSS